MSAVPLDPTGDEARSWLRRELLHPDYHQDNLVRDLLTWLQRQVDRGVDAARHAPPLSTLAAMLLFLLLLAALTWLVARTRRSGRAAGVPGPVLPDGPVPASLLRERARTALEAGRFEEALVEAFRALAVGQVERGRLEDLPGATAHEVATVLCVDLGGDHATRVRSAADRFDAVRYGGRPATRSQAEDVLALDDQLAVAR